MADPAAYSCDGAFEDSRINHNLPPPAMNKPLAELMAKAAKMLPPQKPGTYKCYLPLFLQMQQQGHAPKDMAEFLISEGEVPESRKNSCYRSIRDLLKRNAPTVPQMPAAQTTPPPNLP